MPDQLRSPIKHHLVLHRIDPEQGLAQFYSLMIERDLFGRVVLVRNYVLPLERPLRRHVFVS
jgi:hypothetical protein